LQKSAPHPRTRRSRIGGFSMVELAVSMTVLLILTAIAIPSLMRSFRTYQLNDAAARLSDMLKFTRFEAVRKNRPVCFLMKQDSTTGAWTLGTDSACSATFDTYGKQQLISGFVSILPAGGLPSTGSITSTLGAAGPLTPLSSSPVSVTFDARGAVSPLTANILYVGSATNPEFGYRAVILLPSGTTQVWSAPSRGPWQRVG
jgi:Tfp pilus assembly protein FimT